MKQTNTDKTAWWLWVISTLIVIAAISMYAFNYRAGMDPGEDKVVHYLAQQSFAQRMWQLEFLGMIGMGIAAAYFAISDKSLGWVTVAFGQLIVMVMYAIMLGGYPMTAAAYQDTPVLMDALNQIAIILFAISNVIVMAGFAGILLTTTVLPNWLAKSAGVLALGFMVGAFLIFLEFLTFDSLAVMGPAALVVYLVLALYGYRHIASTGNLEVKNEFSTGT